MAISFWLLLELTVWLKSDVLFEMECMKIRGKKIIRVHDLRSFSVWGNSFYMYGVWGMGE